MSDLPQEALNRALACARHGWPVFPCQPGSKEPATRHGFRDATTDPDQIRRWWERIPAANLAIATGRPGPDVLDIDQHGLAGNGYAAARRLRQAGLLDRPETIVATPNAGLHLYFTGSTQSSGRLPRHHLDFKASGGYVLAPPSRVRGRPYRIIASQAEPANLDWSAVTQVLEPQRQRQPHADPAVAAHPGRLAAWVARLDEGNRNSGLFWAACRTIEADQNASLDDLAAAAARTGLTDREIARTIASARRAHLAQPEDSRGREAAR